jgi:hypothetical protein
MLRLEDMTTVTSHTHVVNSHFASQSRRDDLSIGASTANGLCNSFRSDLRSRKEVTPKGVKQIRRAVSIDRSSLTGLTTEILARIISSNISGYKSL